MEFLIDFAAVREIVTKEYSLACIEIAQLGAMNALRQSLLRQDDCIARAGDVSSLACKDGCYWCCYFSVDVRPVEVFSILQFVQQNFTAQEKERVRNEIETNSALLKNLSELERAQRNIKCPFLANGRCTIYAVRPQTCRNYHATDVTGCKKSFEEPDNLDIDPEFAPIVYQTGGAQVEAFSKAMHDAGYDVTAYELNIALNAVFADPKLYLERLESKQKVFDSLSGIDVPYEFIE